MIGVTLDDGFQQPLNVRKNNLRRARMSGVRAQRQHRKAHRDNRQIDEIIAGPPAGDESPCREWPDVIANEQPACLIDWRAYTAGKPQAIISRYRRDVPGGLYVPLDEAGSIDDALTLLRRELRQRIVTTIEIPATAPYEPKTAIEAVEIAMKECTELVFLEEALSSAQKSQFPRPAKVLTYLRVMNDVVKAWRAEEIDSDGFSMAFASRGVSGYRSGISPTASQDYASDYTRIYRGEAITLGPHIANRVGPVTRILRIYWWTDKVDRTFVVGHVGCKLRDASNR